MFENLCPVWQGEFNDTLHLNTLSIDNIISLLSLYQGKIEEANDFTEILLNSEVKLFFELIRGRQFDKVRDQIAKLINFSVTYYNVILKSITFMALNLLLSNCLGILLLTIFIHPHYNTITVVISIQ